MLLLWLVPWCLATSKSPRETTRKKERTKWQLVAFYDRLVAVLRRCVVLLVCVLLALFFAGRNHSDYVKIYATALLQDKNATVETQTFSFVLAGQQPAWRVGSFDEVSCQMYE